MHGTLPVYCETWLYPPGAFPAEPINTATSFAPVVLGVLALLFLLRRTDQGYIAYGLAVLLVLTGLGSIAWHALRTDLTLTLDALPGVIYFVVLLFFWVYYLGGRYFGVLPIALIIAIIVFFRPASQEEARIVVIGVVVALAAGLLAATWLRKRHAFKFALATVGFALVAAALRSIDLSVCETIPFGTHFFWHIFLATAAYSGVRMMVSLRNGTVANGG